MNIIIETNGKEPDIFNYPNPDYKKYHFENCKVIADDREMMENIKLSTFDIEEYIKNNENFDKNNITDLIKNLIGHYNISPSDLLSWDF